MLIYNLEKSLKKYQISLNTSYTGLNSIYSIGHNIHHHLFLLAYKDDRMGLFDAQQEEFLYFFQYPQHTQIVLQYQLLTLDTLNEYLYVLEKNQVSIYNIHSGRQVFHQLFTTNNFQSQPCPIYVEQLGFLFIYNNTLKILTRK